jgi:hypothetical protein
MWGSPVEFREARLDRHCHRVVDPGVQIDEPSGALRMSYGERRDLVAAERVSNEHGPFDLQRVECRADVRDPRRQVVSIALRLVGLAEANTCHTHDMESVSETRGEVVEDMR